MSYFYHEKLYRNADLWSKIENTMITICGAGALGANIAENLARMGFRQIRLIDRDRIEERNLSTQPYFRSDIGAQKARILANGIYRALNIKIEAIIQELTSENAEKLLTGIVLDCFDNSASRQVVREACVDSNLECLHVGLANGYAEFVWNESYRVPSSAQDDICDYPLARNLVLLATAIASEKLLEFLATGSRKNYSLTLNDLRIEEL